eukprot:9486600-Pyramimonas_sp.AAC.2
MTPQAGVVPRCSLIPTRVGGTDPPGSTGLGDWHTCDLKKSIIPPYPQTFHRQTPPSSLKPHPQKRTQTLLPKEAQIPQKAQGPRVPLKAPPHWNALSTRGMGTQCARGIGRGMAWQVRFGEGGAIFADGVRALVHAGQVLGGLWVVHGLVLRGRPRDTR